MFHRIARLGACVLLAFASIQCGAETGVPSSSTGVPGERVPPAPVPPPPPPPTEAPIAGLSPAQGRVIWTEDPQHRAVVAWTTADEGEQHHLHYDTEPRRGDLSLYRFRVECQRNDQFSMARPELYFHHAALRDLTPATTYYFAMVSDGTASRELHFRTAADDDRPFKIVQGGDSRSDREMRRRMNVRIGAMAAADDSILAFAHGGDYTYNGISLALWSEWLTDHELTVTAAGRVLPIIPARGNHEVLGILFDEVFASPGGGFGRNYYATRLGANVLLVTLNSEIAAGGRQRAFLAGSLKSHAAVRWQVVQYHSSILPAVKEPSRPKPHWQPVFEEFNVDVVLECDGHALKRTPPLRGEAVDASGVVYLGEGGLGVPQRTPVADRWYLQAPGMSASAHHVWEVSFSPESLRARAIGVDGLVLDRVARKPRARP